MTAAQYEAACQSAATSQGLDPITARLTAEDIDHDVEQTGGFTMVVTARRADGVVAITADVVPGGETEDRPYLVGFYPGETWDDGEYDDLVEEFFDRSLDEVVAIIQSH